MTERSALRMDRERFEKLVAEAVGNLPEEFLDRLDNVDVVVDDCPTAHQRRSIGKHETLLGLYEGIPLTERDSRYGLVPPDKITIFQKPVESICADDDSIKREVQRVVRHEIAHHFGIGDERLDEIEGRGDEEGHWG